MAMQRPGRPTTRVGPAAKRTATQRTAPVTKPATGPVQKQSPATGRGRPTSRTGPAQGGSRPVPKQQQAKSNTMLFVGIGAGALVLIAGAFFVMSGKSDNHAPTTTKQPSKPKAVDVSGLERDGISKCNEGLALVQKNQAQLGSHELSGGAKQSLVADLEKGKKLLSDGLALLTQANEKSNSTYDTKQYQEALITVRKKLMELRE